MTQVPSCVPKNYFSFERKKKRIKSKKKKIPARVNFSIALEANNNSSFLRAD
jgi:hypothetical protein